MDKRRVDALVAQEMGWTLVHRKRQVGYRIPWAHPGQLVGKAPDDEWHPVPFFTVHINAACLAWDMLPWPKYYTRLVQTDTGNWRFDIEANGGDGPTYSASAETRELAICLAFLQARGVEVPDEK